MTTTDGMCDERKEEADLQALRIVLMQRYDSNTTSKSSEGDWLQ